MKQGQDRGDLQTIFATREACFLPWDRGENSHRRGVNRLARPENEISGRCEVKR